MASERSLSRIGLHSVRRLSDRELAVKLDELNAQKYALDAELLLYLSEIERRGLYREQACSSLFVFCVTRLGQSEDVAYKRVGAARLMLKCPEIYELLGNGRIHLSGLMLLRPHLNPDNCQELLSAASGKSKRQIEELIAVRFPQPDVPTTERRLPPSRARRTMADSPTSEATRDAAASKTHTDSDAATVATPASDTARRVTSTSVDGTSTIAAARTAPAPTTSPDESVTAPHVTATSVDESVTARRATSTSVDESSIDEPSTIAAARIAAAPTTSPDASTVTAPRETATSVDESVTAPRETATSVDESSPDEPSTIAAARIAAAPTTSPDASTVTALGMTSTVPSPRVTSTSVDESSIDEPSTIASHTAPTQISTTALTTPAPSANRATPAATAPAATAPAATAPSPHPAARSRVDPLSGHSYRVTFTASARLKQKMDRARELLSHAISPSDLPALLERALDQLLKREERRRYGSSRCNAPKSERPRREASECERPRREASECQNQEHEHRQQEPLVHAARQHESQHRQLQASCQKHAETRAELQDPAPISDTWAKPRSRYVPAAVERAVWTRDAGQCTFRDRTGRRCEQRHFLELDHIEAFAIGGDATVENLRLRCRAHNALEAEKLFGRERIERIIAHETQAR